MPRWWPKTETTTDTTKRGVAAAYFRITLFFLHVDLLSLNFFNDADYNFFVQLLSDEVHFLSCLVRLALLPEP